MPITKGAQKAHRASLRKRVFNVRCRKAAVNDIGKEKSESWLQLAILKKQRRLLTKAYKAIDKAAKRGVIKTNTAARKKSRLVAAIKRSQ
ncbi:MAG: 30S ribosomal protein S20 [Candidatus Paceibacterota bacterium]